MNIPSPLTKEQLQESAKERKVQNVKKLLKKYSSDFEIYGDEIYCAHEVQKYRDWEKKEYQ
jgi:hypothetical protein